MPISIRARNINGGDVSYDIDYPDECPICNRHVAPAFQYAAEHTANDGIELQAVFRCTNRRCDHLYIGTYLFLFPPKGDGFCLQRLEPKRPVSRHFEKSIHDVSPSFITIYEQAIAAESHNLDQIVGIGLRKALEFLIKDFAVKMNSDREDAIKKARLNTVITEYIDDTNLKEVAKLASWLGNDETHYERIWIEKDITDLKRLIQLGLNWIDTVITTKEYSAEMTPKEEEK